MLMCRLPLRLGRTRRLCLAALLVLCLGGLTVGAQEVPADARERFDRALLPAVEAATRRPPTQEGGDIAWGVSYQLQALVLMTEATRDSKYAEATVKLSDWAVKSRDDRQGLRDEVRDRIAPVWSSTAYTKGKRYAWAVHTGMIVEPMARFAAVVRADPALKERWGPDADRLLKVAEEAVAAHDGDYREGPGTDEGYLHSLYLEKHVPLNMQNALARAWLAIDDATGEPKHRERTARLARFLKNRLRSTDDGAYAWAYWPPLEGDDPSFEDVSHASINADFMALCHERDIVFTREDMTRLEKTFLNRVLLADNRVNNTLAGGDQFDRYRLAAWNWGRLAQRSPKVRERLIQFDRHNPAPPLGLAYLSLPPLVD